MRVHLETIGCRANQYDTEAVRAMILAAGHQIAVDAGDADFAVINSCAVTAEAEADLRQRVRRASRANPALRTVVMGCASAMPESRATITSLPSVERVIAGADMTLVASALELDASVVSVIPIAQRGSRALLRLQDGCDEHCTFCATRIARGGNRSRKPAALVAEARALAEHHGEIVLTGVHIGSYGVDLQSSLGHLLERLVRDVPHVRFRLSSVEATEVDDRLGEMLASDACRVAPYLHAPLQSGSDRMLKRMGRNWYTAAEYVAAVERLADKMPVFGLGADVIAGFPGETEEDHALTLALVSALPYSSLHVFQYSARPGTAAARMPNHVRNDVIARRAGDLRALGTEKARRYATTREGGEADVLVIDGGPKRRGLTEDYLTVTVTDGRHGRGARFHARLEGGSATLVARPTEVGHQFFDSAR